LRTRQCGRSTPVAIPCDNDPHGLGLHAAEGMLTMRTPDQQKGKFMTPDRRAKMAEILESPAAVELRKQWEESDARGKALVQAGMKAIAESHTLKAKRHKFIDDAVERGAVVTIKRDGNGEHVITVAEPTPT
jgi:hypothetical protein